MTIPTYLPYFVSAGTAATLMAILYGLNRALADAAWSATERTQAFRVSAFILLGWLVLSIVLAAIGFYHVDSTAIPTIQYGIALPILIGVLLIWRSETARRVLDAMPQPWLVRVQLYRALGVIFLILYASNKLPAFFAWPAGVTTGFMTAPSLLQPIPVEPSSDLMTVLPMVLIPVYLVPLSIVLHIASLAKLHRSADVTVHA